MRNVFHGIPPRLTASEPRLWVRAIGEEFASRRGKAAHATLFATTGLLLIMGLSPDARAQVVNPNPGGTTVSTASFTDSLQFAPATTATTAINTYSTEIVGKLNGGTPLYDQTFSAAFSSQTVQGGVTAARAAITTAGGPGVVIGAPVLVSHNVTTSSTSSSIYSLDRSTPYISGTLETAPTAPYVTTTLASTFGPAQTNGAVSAQAGGAGDYRSCGAAITGLPSATKPVCGSASSSAGVFIVNAGQQDINLNYNSAYLIDTTTTETDTTTTNEIYDVNGQSVQGFGTVHDAVADAGFTAGDRFSRSLLGAGQGGGVEAFGSSNWRVWEEAYGYSATIGHQGSISGYSNLTGGLRGGVSFQADDNFQIGAGLDYGAGTLDENAANEFGNLHLFQGGVNLGWHQDNLFATLAGTYGAAGASTQITPNGVVQTALSKYGFHIASVAGEGGIHFDLGDGFALSPSLGAAYYNIDQGAFTETGSVLALTAARHSFERSKEWLGLTGSTDIGLDGTILTLTAYGRAAFWGGDTTIALPVTFVGSTTALSLTGTSSGTAAGEAGASIGWKAFSTVSFFASYDTEFQARTALQTLSVGLNIAL